MKKSMIATAVLATFAFAPSSAFANYYSYERCMNNGGNWFTCLGALASDDGSIVSPDIKNQFGFAKEEGKDRIMESLKARSKVCDRQKGDARVNCYSKGLKADLRVGAVAKPMPAQALTGGKKEFADKVQDHFQHSLDN
ncbi:hypothetical protein TL5118_03386 [Thalassovita autumnalis]|uniref:Uncharacterized protein n=1 Tax=Thalassovita autumnalis TaxID=2072972 RepID=A0A0N7LWL4_9RHOB|nr:hypothetical protein [Thalassovita autumnalis]CUH69426.1 hypothetical protein TL5118_03386 [Thalassovita autumnalis]CUH70765.1 hypothetical protein TL5120_00545 [Thalassovita autumnalis]